MPLLHPPTKPLTTVAMLTNSFVCSSESFVTNELTALQQHGLPFQLFALQRGDVAAPAAMPVIYLPSLQRRANVLSIAAACLRCSRAMLRLALQQPRQLYRAVKLLGRDKELKLHQLLQACWLARRLQTDPRYCFTAVHSHWANAPANIAWLTATLLKLPYSFAAHANDVFCQSDSLLRAKLATAAFACACNPAAADRLRTLSQQLGSEKPAMIADIAHGVDLTTFPFRGIRSELATPPQLLILGRLVAKKGIDTILQALHGVGQHRISFRCIIAGSGSDYAELHALATHLQLQTHIDWIGTVAAAAVPALLAKADVLLLGSRILANGDQDGIANVLLEAMATGVPVIATDIAGSRRLIRHDDNGLLVPPQQPAAMTAAIVRLLNDQLLRNRLVGNARRTIVQNYNQQDLITQRLQMFRSYL